MDDLEIREVYQRILVAGGGEVQQAKLNEARRAGTDGDSLTHIIADPWILEPGDPRYRAFQKWTRIHGGGGTKKIFYTFLLYKVTIPHGTIEEAEYDISLRKIQREARARARLRQQNKINEEAAELTYLKETIVQRKPGRTYKNKSSEVFRPKSEQKRKAEWDEDSSSLGSAQRKKVKNPTGWS